MKEGLFKAQQEMIDGARHEAVRSGGVTPTYEEYLDWFRDETWRRCSVVLNDYDWFVDRIKECYEEGTSVADAISIYVEEVREDSPSFEDADQEPDLVSTGHGDTPLPDRV